VRVGENCTEYAGSARNVIGPGCHLRDLLLERTSGAMMTSVRKQFHLWPGEEGHDAWDVERLIELSKGLAVSEIPLDSISEVDTAYWFTGNSDEPTVRTIVDHMRLVHEVDPAYPIILGADGRVMDGMHRIARALLRGETTIRAVQFQVQPEPDHRNCSAADRYP